MRKIRNPRYAPEFLEKKLSPTDLLGGLTATAAVSCMSTDTTYTTLNDPPPILPPPTGPVGPA